MSLELHDSHKYTYAITEITLKLCCYLNKSMNKRNELIEKKSMTNKVKSRRYCFIFQSNLARSQGNQEHRVRKATYVSVKIVFSIPTHNRKFTKTKSETTQKLTARSEKKTLGCNFFQQFSTLAGLFNAF